MNPWVGTCNPTMSKITFTLNVLSSGLEVASIFKLFTLGSKFLMVSLIWSSIVSRVSREKFSNRDPRISVPRSELKNLSVGKVSH